MGKVAVILSGCGVFDGTEVTEAVSVFLALEENHLGFDTFAPDIEQAHVINHGSGEAEASEVRNVLTESNRISRGTTQSLEALDVSRYSAVILVGGFGAAKNLCDLAFKGPEMTVQPLVEKKLREFNQAEKWISGVCIAPVILAKLFKGVVTIGNDPDTVKVIESFGATHEQQDVSCFTVDRDNKLITTPAFMLASNYSEARLGISNTVSELAALLSE